MTLRQAVRICERLASQINYAALPGTSQINYAALPGTISTSEADALQRLIAHAKLSVTQGQRIPRNARLGPMRGPRN